MFSRASLLSVKMLRAYHEQGILVPASVDRRTGYRAYTVDQLGDAAVLRRLRSLDLPLEQARTVLQRRDPLYTADVLAAHQRTMTDRLAQTQRIVNELQSDFAPVTHTPVHSRIEPARHTLRIVGSVASEDVAAYLDWAYGRLAAVLESAGVLPSGPAGALYPAEVADDDVEQVVAFLPLASPFAIPALERDCTIGEISTTEVAVLVHPNGYETISDTYRALGAWVARNATHTGQPVREWYVVGPTETDDPANYRTEIAWPISGLRFA